MNGWTAVEILVVGQLGERKTISVALLIFKIRRLSHSGQKGGAIN
jgi:hypothetical protein